MLLELSQVIEQADEYGVPVFFRAYTRVTLETGADFIKYNGLPKDYPQVVQMRVKPIFLLLVVPKWIKKVFRYR
jgi:DhnA family fructose-bisphosphate aldolase class Ia